MLAILDRAGTDPRENLAWEERVFADARAAPAPRLLFYVNAPCVVLGRGNAEAAWVDAAACAADGVPVLRRFSGGGTVYHDAGNLNFSFIMPTALLNKALRPYERGPSVHSYIDFFRSLVIRTLRQRGTGYAASGVSDITLDGKKISGNAQRIANEVVLHHGTMLFTCDLAAIERYLPIPPDRPGVPHRGFVGGLHELGREYSMAQVKNWIADEFVRTLSLLP